MLTSGCLKVYVSNKQGCESVHIGFLMPGDILGEEGLFESDHVSLCATVSYQPLSDATLHSVSHDVVKKAAKLEPGLVREVALHINKRLALTTSRLSQLLFMNIEERAYECLLSVSMLPGAMTHPSGTQIKFTRIELAEMVNCARETAGRAIQRLETSGLIKARGQQIILLGVRHGKAVNLGPSSTLEASA